MPREGCYQWWRDHFSGHPEYQRICAILQKLGFDTSQTEVDHFPPNIAYRGTSFETQLAEGARPAFPIPKYLHRYHRGEADMGGHASTTGSGGVARQWSGQIRTHMQGGNFYAAMKQDIIDKQNIALFATQGLDRNLFNGLLRQGVRLAFDLGMITEQEYWDLMLNHLEG